MINIEITNYHSIVCFWLIFTRLLPILIQTPLFENVSVPNIVKILATVVITFCIYPDISPIFLKDIQSLGTDHFWFLTIFNAMIGLVTGYFIKAIMTIFSGAGGIITQQIGFSAIRYFDLSSSQQVGPFEKLISWCVIIMILKADALFPIFKGIISSMEGLTFLDFKKLGSISQFSLHFLKNAFLSALILSSPLIFMNIFIMTVLGIISRIVPQMNILMVSFVVNIGLGLLVFFISTEEFFTVSLRIYTEKLGEWYQYFN